MQYRERVVELRDQIQQQEVIVAPQVQYTAPVVEVDRVNAFGQVVERDLVGTTAVAPTQFLGSQIGMQVAAPMTTMTGGYRGAVQTIGAPMTYAGGAFPGSAVQTVAAGSII